MSIMVTGGAGYIGSHVVRLLQNRGSKVLVVDNLSTGLDSRLSGVDYLNLDLASPEAETTLLQAMNEGAVEAVIHLAALKQVGQSVEQPERYFQKNVGGMANLLLAMQSAKVKKLVFSSSAASYGMPNVELVSEDLEAKPINPYGQTKLVGEWMAQNAERAWGLRQVSLRYFNVAGAGWPDLADTQKLNLIPIVFAALAEGKQPQVFGTDYPTPDGSCIRDYVHVLDLATAHLKALEFLENENREFDVFNVGTGIGSSVIEVLNKIRQITGKDFDYVDSPARAGDPPKLVANVARIEKAMGWKAENGLEEIIASSWKALNA